jgi:glucose/arabinose dehydrogenase
MKFASLLVISAGLAGATALAVPPGFVDEVVVDGWDRAVGFAFATDGRAIVWERSGLVWTVVNGVKDPAPLIDIRDEVRNFGDYGLLGVAVDPQFLNNGRIYLFYAVDYYHLVNFGSPGYNPAVSDLARDSIGRITRYTCDPASGFRTVVAGSRTVLVGESKETGVPLVFQSHGTGTIAFAPDGSLLAGSGDSASFVEPDTGGPRVGSTNTALADGIMLPKEDVGSYRSQLVDSLAGKIIRIDPQTGDGLPNNPYFDPVSPRAARSRVWTLGLRNPFRFGVRPGSATVNRPVGTLYIGDVGWERREELNVVRDPGANCGWPVFEGNDPVPEFAALASPANLDAPNPLFGGLCTISNFRFRDLIVQESLVPASWPNPCDPGQFIGPETTKFRHHRPALAWGHGGPTTVSGFASGQAVEIDVTGPNSPIAGVTITGSSITAGDWQTTDAMGTPYHGAYFAADFVGRQIVAMNFDTEDQLLSVAPFHTAPNPIVAMAVSPADGNLYYLAFRYSGPGALRRIARIPCAADLNNDLVVMDDDFVIFVQAYNNVTCANPPPATCHGDFNLDGVVDDTDFQMFVAAYNAVFCP